MSDLNLKALPKTSLLHEATDDPTASAPSKKLVLKCLANLGLPKGALEKLDPEAQQRCVALFSGEPPPLMVGEGDGDGGVCFAFSANAGAASPDKLVAFAADLETLHAHDLAAHLLAAGAVCPTYSLPERVRCIEECGRMMGETILDGAAALALVAEATAILKYSDVQALGVGEWQPWLKPLAQGIPADDLKGAVLSRCKRLVRAEVSQLLQIDFSTSAAWRLDDLWKGAMKLGDDAIATEVKVQLDLYIRHLRNGGIYSTGDLGIAPATATTTTTTTTTTTSADAITTTTTSGTDAIEPAPARARGPKRTLEACLQALGVDESVGQLLSDTAKARLIDHFCGHVPRIRIGETDDGNPTFEFSPSGHCDPKDIVQIARDLSEVHHAIHAYSLLAAAATRREYSDADRVWLIQEFYGRGHGKPIHLELAVGCEASAITKSKKIKKLPNGWEEIVKQLKPDPRETRYKPFMKAVAKRTAQLLQDDTDPSPSTRSLARRRPSMNFQQFISGTDKPKEKERDTPVFKAVKHGDLATIQALVGKGDIHPNHSITQDGDTLLALASKYGHDAIVSYLLAKRFPVDRANERGETPLWLASKAGHADVVVSLLGAGSQREISDALAVAAKYGRVGVVKRLGGTEAEKKNAAKQACLYGQLEVLRCLKVKSMTGREAAALYGAASKNGHAHIVAWLIESEVGLDVRNGKGQSAVDIACANGHLKVVKLLVNAGWKFDATQAQLASDKGHKDIARWLTKQIGAKLKAEARESSEETSV